MLRVLVLVTAGIALQAAVAEAAREARSAPRAITSSMTVTGEIQNLGPGRVGVARLACAIPARLSASAGRFVIGDPVKLTCQNGKLRSLRYSPELATAQTDAPGGGNAPATVSSPPVSFDPSKARAISYTVGTLFLGGGPTGETDNATGPVSDLSDGSITAGGLTCSLRPSLSNLLAPLIQLGDNVTLTCTGGTFVHLASVGTITRS